MLTKNALQAVARDIALVVFDVDGVLTDGTLAYSASGEEVKFFNVKDGVGIKLLQTYGIEVAVISAKGSAALDKRMQDLGIKHFYPATKDKLVVLSTLMAELDIEWTQVAYVGDDIIDLKVMRHVALAVSPADGYKLVREFSHVVTDVPGGKGVAREVADIILSSRMDLAEAYTKAMLPEFESADFKQKLGQKGA